MISLIVPVQDPSPFSPLSLEAGLERNLARVAEAGYNGVELAITDPSSIEIREIKQLLARYNLEVPAITTGQAFLIEGLSLTGFPEKTRQRAIRRIGDHIGIARELGAMVIIGLIRGKGGGKEAEKRLIGALQECTALDPTVKLTLEPLNRYETELINNVAEALEILDRVGAENLGILFDTFHANIEEASLEESIRRADGRIFHVHVADSNRWAPGYGHLNFKGILSTLQEIGYQGFLSAEVLSKPDPNTSIKQTIYYLKQEAEDGRVISEIF